METSRKSRLIGGFAAAIFSSQFALLAVAFRGGPGWLVEPRFLLPALVSLASWALVVAAATTPARRAVAAGLASTLLVVQVQVFRHYHAALDVQVAASALHAWSDVGPVVSRELPALVAAMLFVAAFEYATLARVHRSGARLVPRRGVLAIAVVVGLVVLPIRDATPDVRGLHALVALRDKREAPVRVRMTGAVSLPPLHADRAELPSVLFVLSESVRAEDYGAETAPESVRTATGRVDLGEMRAVSSYTAVSFSALLTGRSQEGAREEILRAPNLFDFAHAARDAHGERPAVAYLSMQSDDVFETKDVRAAVDRFATVETLLGHGPDDADPRAAKGRDPLLVDAFEAELRTLPQPSVVMLHLTDTHAPYSLDPEHAPYQPVEHVVAWSRMGELHNAYKDAIYTQDRAVARAVGAFVERAKGHPWLVVFTSDHGEAFGEHGAIHHGQNLFDEQVHVPAWIAAGPGTLSEAQARALADHAGRFTTHLDLLPTVLDAMGLWDNFSVAAHRAAMPGQSLLRPWRARGPIPVTNCTGMFPCPTNTWGYYEEDHKLLARIYDPTWTCLAVGGGPERIVEDPVCESLRAASRRTFPLLPNGSPNR